MLVQLGALFWALVGCLCSGILLWHVCGHPVPLGSRSVRYHRRQQLSLLSFASAEWDKCAAQ
jgi:hypothetical protein